MNLYKMILLLAVTSLAMQSSAQTKKEDKIDEEYQECLGKDTSYGAISNCAFVAFGKWDKEMNKTYDRLLKTVKKPNDKAAIKQSQKAWLAYKDAEFNSFNNIYNRPGNEWSMLRQDGRIEIVRARTLQLRQYLESLDEHTFLHLFPVRQVRKK